MNEKVLRHKEICDGLNELYARKNHDYGDSFHTTFVEEGLAMARIRLGDKFSRFKTLSRLSCNDRDQQQVTDESIRDTLLDLANYAIMTVLEMDICMGMAASMGAFLLSAGTKGKRLALPNSTIMIHQPSGGAQGQATDMRIHTEWILEIKKRLNRMLSDATGQPLEVIERDTERDNFMSAQQALEYGLIDKIIEKR